MQQSSVEIASVLRNLAASLERGDSTIVQLANEEIFIPATSDVSCKYETVGGTNELKIRVTWDLFPSPPQLIRQHSDTVQDSLGNLYEVFIYGAPRLDGTWEGWIEFVPLSPALPSLRTDRETTQPDLGALEYWSTGLEPMYLAGAFERAKSG
jgi:amphi-Trp domain-containing protein